MSNGGTVLVTGGCGYIGSHTVLELIEINRKVVVLDNLSNASQESLKRVSEITNQSTDIGFCNADLRDENAVREVFKRHGPFSHVVHFAGLKAVGESNDMPIEYYDNNVNGTLVLLRVMKEFGTAKMVFSSSATVYGPPERLPIDESHPLRATNPYGRTKLFIEEILRDATKAEHRKFFQSSKADDGTSGGNDVPALSCVCLRYFNPTGAHPSGKIGEDPSGIPNNLMPFVAQVAIGKRDKLAVFGNDWDTKDGTGVRDFIHVVDLAKGHLAAINKVDKIEAEAVSAKSEGHSDGSRAISAAAEGTLSEGCAVFNLGTGTGYSVLEMVAAFEKASGKDVPYVIAPRREGDIGSCYADPKNAQEGLEWKAEKGLQEMVEDMWRWQEMNPDGFPKSQ